MLTESEGGEGLKDSDLLLEVERTNFSSEVLSGRMDVRSLRYSIDIDFSGISRPQALEHLQHAIDVRLAEVWELWPEFKKVS